MGKRMLSLSLSLFVRPLFPATTIITTSLFIVC
jgi:hypothetical protein